MWDNLDERQEVVLSKYKLKGETHEEFLKRVTFGNEELFEIFKNKEGIWGGRNLYAIGREGNITGSNCYVAKDPEDSLEDIYRADYHLARTYSFGGGQGLNLSKIRPKDAKVNNTSSTSPGPMVFAEKYSHTTLNTQQAKRRGALMLMMDVSHPDILDFATAKLDLTKINGANISLAITDDFMEAVENDGIWEMTFETPYQIITRTAKARDLMEVIAYANHTMGDPGMVFIDNVNRYHLLSEYPDVKFTATNPCGEQPLMANGSCNLGSVNLYAFVRDPFTEDAYFDAERFVHVVKHMTWGLDELLTMLGDRHALAEQRAHVPLWREIGLGVMGLADLALGMSMAYGSDGFIDLLEDIMKLMANAAAQASAERAKELGTFERYDYDLISKSTFFKHAYLDETKEMIKEYGLRNSRILSIAPTGSISNVLGVSGGVEPFFMLGYNRTIQSMFEAEKTITVWEKTPKALAAYLRVDSIDELPYWAKITSQNIEFEERAAVQATIQNYVDTAISSTFNLPNEATIQNIIDIYHSAHGFGLKGATVFRDNCAKVGILSGVNGWQIDENEAPTPKILITETWFDKETGTTTTTDKIFTVEGPESLGPIIKKVDKPKTVVHNSELVDVCPLCGAPLVKQGGCHKCSDNECDYERCDI
jgi:ribonucleoside-diphosphate reductase alpha chain